MRRLGRVDAIGGAGVRSAKAQIRRAYRHAAISHRTLLFVGKAESRGNLRMMLAEQR